MNLHQVIELDSGAYRVEADITEDELTFFVSVALSYLLKAGSIEFVTKLLGEKGSVSILPTTPKPLQ